MAARTQPLPPSAEPAENDAAWPTLAALLAPAAGCDCQMLAVTLADRDEHPPAEPRIAER